MTDCRVACAVEEVDYMAGSAQNFRYSMNCKEQVPLLVLEMMLASPEDAEVHAVHVRKCTDSFGNARGYDQTAVFAASDSAA